MYFVGRVYRLTRLQKGIVYGGEPLQVSQKTVLFSKKRLVHLLQACSQRIRAFLRAFEALERDVRNTVLSLFAPECTPFFCRRIGLSKYDMMT